MDNTIADEYIEWAYHPFAYSFSTGCLPDPSAPSSSSMFTMPSTDLLNDEYMQYLHHPSTDTSTLYHPHQQTSPIEEEGDDDDSLDFSIATPHPFLLPTFTDPSKENQVSSSSFLPFQSHYNMTNDNGLTMTPSTSSRTSSLSSLSSNSISTCADWSSNFPGESLSTTSAMTRSYVSLSDVNAFVAKADSIKHSASVHSYMSVLNNQEPPLPESSLPSSSSWYDFPSTSTAPFPSSSQSSYSPSSLPTSSIPTSLCGSSDMVLEGQNLGLAFSKNDTNPDDDDSGSEAPFYQTHLSRRSSLNSFNLKKPNESDDYEDVYQENEEEEEEDSEDDDDDYGYFQNPTTQKVYRRRQPGNRRKGTSNKTKHHHHHHHSQHNKSSYMTQKSITLIKKGRNVDKACNHCKRSHLRCDEMRPCRRCITTGKTGCKDVQHKPRGRPKLHKK